MGDTARRSPAYGLRRDASKGHGRRTNGTLFVSSGLSFTGYTDGQSKEVVEGMLSTGDTGHFDETGMWSIDGRDDDMIVFGGENVFPLEVENLLDGHPDIVEAAVIGVNDAELGKRLRAFVVARSTPSLNDEELKSYVRSRLARHKVPRDVLFVDALPRNETGKLLRAQLTDT
ncbi:AMP-binding enzyme [Mycobacterium sp. 050128]|uniref:AMP-binding enzyme n=1 Tax=Mycobacterium sp. 050128 TaxID=3096112 RepID=UPI003FA5EEC6